MAATDETSSALSEPLSAEATVFTVSLEAVVFEFSLEGDAEPRIGYARPNQIRVGNRLIPSTVRKVETLARYIDIGDELRVKVVRVAKEEDKKVVTYTEEGEDGQAAEVEIQPDWVAVECEKKERLGSPTAPPSTPSTPVSAVVAKKRVSSSGSGGTPGKKQAKTVVSGEKGKPKTKSVAKKAAVVEETDVVEEDVNEAEEEEKKDEEAKEKNEIEENEEEVENEENDEVDEDEDLVEIVEEKEDEEKKRRKK